MLPSLKTNRKQKNRGLTQRIEAYQKFKYDTGYYHALKNKSLIREHSGLHSPLKFYQPYSKSKLNACKIINSPKIYISPTPDLNSTPDYISMAKYFSNEQRKKLVIASNLFDIRYDKKINLSKKTCESNFDLTESKRKVILSKSPDPWKRRYFLLDDEVDIISTENIFKYY